MPSRVTEIPPADPSAVAAHYARRLALETDCSDVYAAMTAGVPDFVLLDVRGPHLFAEAHVPERDAPAARKDDGAPHGGLAVGHAVRRLLCRAALQRHRQGGVAPRRDSDISSRS